jgi:8-oxo-dGTP pyrophosphatase MutT (NUDIX family)
VTDAVPVRPASTVVLLREHGGRLETLLLKRNKALFFAGGFWVFPGGAIDAADRAAAGGDLDRAARLAAAREAAEEAGVVADPDAMVPLSHWTTPAVEKRRFATWFFAAPLAADAEVTIDNGEIHAARWLGLAEALAEHAAGELNLMPPTYVTLLNLVAYPDLATVLAAEACSPVPRVEPVLGREGEQLVTIYPGDAAYEGGDPGLAGPRHRCVLEGRQWVFQCRDLPSGCQPLVPAGHGRDERP